MRLGAPLAAIEVGDDGQVACLRLADGSSVEADLYVSAVPVDVFKKLLPASWSTMPFFRQASPLPPPLRILPPPPHLAPLRVPLPPPPRDPPPSRPVPDRAAGRHPGAACYRTTHGTEPTLDSIPWRCGTRSSTCSSGSTRSSARWTGPASRALIHRSLTRVHYELGGRALLLALAAPVCVRRHEHLCRRVRRRGQVARPRALDLAR